VTAAADPYPPALPRFWEFRAPPDWSAVDFISDLHLAENAPRTFEAWSAYMGSTTASAVFILGDLFEVWVGDDSRHAAFESRCAEVLADAATRRTVGFMAGNRDFLVGGDLLRECGVMALSDPTVLVAFGERLMLSHGDALCTADLEYQAFRREVRTAPWQAGFLARPLAERREIARTYRARSEQRRGEPAPPEIFDVDEAAATRWMHEAATPTLVHGHTHRPGTNDLAPGFVRHVLTDWDLDGGTRAEVLRLRRAGLARLSPTDACR
jgi:UDP-2,3-diacylglucosamine hydrolase